MSDVQAATWLLLITNLPGRNPTLRMRLWRTLKAGGTGPLRDGVYVLPNSEESRRAFEAQATEIRSPDGEFRHTAGRGAHTPRVARASSGRRRHPYRRRPGLCG